MSDNTQSYMNFHNYEYYIVSKLNFARVGEELVNAKVITEKERQKIGSISGTRKQNISLVRHLYDERREFGPFLNTLRRDSSCDQHAQLIRTILARSRNKSEDQVDDSDIFPRLWSESDYAERLRLGREDSGSDSDSSAFTYATQDFSDSASFVGSDRERESECEGSEAARRSVTPRGSPNSLRRIQNVSQNKQIERKSGPVTIMVIFLFVFAILTMPLKFGNRVRKFILQA